MPVLPAEIPANGRHSRKSVAPIERGGRLSSASSSRMRDAASKLGDGSIMGVSASSSFNASNAFHSRRQSSQIPRCCSKGNWSSSGSSPYCARMMFCCAISHFILRTSTASKSCVCPCRVRVYSLACPLMARKFCCPLSCICESCSQLSRSAKQRVLGCLFGCRKHLANRPQLQTLIMLELKDRTLPRGQLI